MSTFDRHPAFSRGIERRRQIKQLGDIAAVMPMSPQADIAGAWVRTAILDERAVPHAMRALDEMPEADRRSVFIASRAMA